MRGVVLSQQCIMDQEVENIASVNEYRVETVNFTQDMKQIISFSSVLTYCQFCVSDMYSLARLSSRGLHLNSHILPKQCLFQLNVHFDTFARATVEVQKSPASKDTDRKKVIPKYVHNFYLPMGSKRTSFSDRSNKLKEVNQTQLKVIKSKENVDKMNKLPNPSKRQTLWNKRKSHKNRKSEVLLCNSDLKSSNLSHSDKGKEKESKKPNLEFISYLLTQDLTDVFMKRQEWNMYHKEVVLQDNIRGVRDIDDSKLSHHWF